MLTSEEVTLRARSSAFFSCFSICFKAECVPANRACIHPSSVSKQDRKQQCRPNQELLLSEVRAHVKIRGMDGVWAVLLVYDHCLLFFVQCQL